MRKVRIAEIDKKIAELYDKLHEAVNTYVNECECMMMRREPYADIDKIVEQIAQLKVEQAILSSIKD